LLNVLGMVLSSACSIRGLVLSDSLLLVAVVRIDILICTVGRLLGLVLSEVGCVIFGLSSLFLLLSELVTLFAEACGWNSLVGSSCYQGLN